jgi:cobalt/nickel transport system permease protein
LFLFAGVALSRLPQFSLLLRAAVVLPFSGTFAVISLLAGDPDRALAVVVKSYLSAVIVLLLVATTPFPQLLNAVEKLGAPRMVVLVVQFLYRYLFVISQQGQHMRQAARCRGDLSAAPRGRRKSRFRAAAGALAVLFGRSYQRAEAIHRAMLARGFDGRFHPLQRPALEAVDFIFLGLAAAIPVGVRLGAGGVF